MFWDSKHNILVLSDEEIIIPEGSSDIYIGEYCTGIKLDGVIHKLSIGNSCVDVSIKCIECEGITIGSFCNNINISESNNNQINNECSYINIKGGGGHIVGGRNSHINLTNCYDNYVEGSNNIDCQADRTVFRQCSSVNVDKKSFNLNLLKTRNTNIRGGLTINTRNIVSGEFENTRNIDTAVSGMHITDGVPFRKYKPGKPNNIEFVKCNIEADDHNYDADYSGSIISSRFTPDPLIDVPNQNNDKIYARYKNQWIAIDELLYGPKDENNIYARYNGKWTAVKKIDPTLPHPQPSKASESVDPDTIVNTDMDSLVVKQ